MKRYAILNSILICLMPSFAAADDKENDLYISFGEEFIIKKDQSANIKESHASIYIKDFFMMSCAVPGFNCGAAYVPAHVIYELQLDGKIVDDRYIDKKRRDPESVLRVVVIESDYKSYAKLKINKLYDECIKNVFSYCWEDLAQKTLNPKFCEFVDNQYSIQVCKQEISSYLNEQ